MKASIINIGNEILEGDTVNTNATWLSSRLTDYGISVERIIVVPDKKEDIEKVLKREKAKRDKILVTGGLGPTHDDITVESIANSFGREVIKDEDIIQKLHQRYEEEDLLDNTAQIPKGAQSIENKVGVDPGFIIKSSEVDLYAFPGVPDEMKAVFKEISEEFKTEQKKEKVENIEVKGHESNLVSIFDEIRNKFEVSVGSYPGDGKVKVKIKGEDAKKAKKNFLKKIDEKKG